MKEAIPASLDSQVKQAALILREGGIVAYPTDTVYGLGADIYNDLAVKKLFTAKDRPMGLPLPVLIDNIDKLEELVSGQTAFTRSLIKRFWPGGLTIIFNKAPHVQSLVLAGSDKIGVRMPDHPVALLLISELGRPIAGTSANLHSGEITLTAGEVSGQIGSRVDYIIDAGRCPGGRESTIVDATAETPRIVRYGAVAESDIMAEYSKTGGK
ncbi:MAG: threonylcarbamoyl-AMP synthase [Dehalococcoidia bacterium]|nr:threonylcarbamoyl-AMP synthase [Dehalococcoidia bacterium]